MNAGPAGFRGAPLSKALVIAAVSSSVILQTASKTSRRRPPLLIKGFMHAMVFKHPGELLFGALLAYYFRLLERQMGTGKYGAYSLIIGGIAYALEAALATLIHRPSASGLYPLLFANLVAFFLEVPPLQRFSVLGVSLSDKAFVYLAAMQLLFSSAQRSVAAGLCGAMAGAAYHFGFLGLQKLRLPRVVEDLVSAAAHRVMGGPTQRQQIYVTPAAMPQGGAAAVAAAAAASPRSEPRRRAVPLVEPSPEAVQQLVDMGFDAARAKEALQFANNNVELALQALL